MVSVAEASQIIQSVSLTLLTKSTPIESINHQVLAEAIMADRDLPPFNRVAMDGIAILAKSFSKNHEYKIEGLQAAGSPQMALSETGNCMKVMTGAILPNGTDAVIPFEDITINGDIARINLVNVQAGLNIHAQGADSKKGDCLLKPGQVLGPAEVALLASVGKTLISVYELPKAAVISTGDELVDITEQPLPHQIRRSNAYAIQAAMRAIGWHANLFHFLDNKDVIRKNLTSLLQDHDVLILSGGVSKGEFDFIPHALEELGVKKLFHHIRQRPGKPFWFGVHPGNKIIFALPGNPVSTFLNFYQYIKPWIYAQMGIESPTRFAVLGADMKFQPELTYFLQVKVKNEKGVLKAYPIPGGGSGDFVNLGHVDGFLELPAEQSDFKTGEVYRYIPFR